MDDPRIDPPLEAEERTTLTAFLDFNRETLALKCDGLTDDQLRERAAPPSSLSLLGIVRHRAEVERNWFRPVLAGEEMRLIYAPDMDWEGAFRDAATGDVSEAFSTWRGMRPRPRAGRGGPGPGDEGFLRSPLVLAPLGPEPHARGVRRHDGHADLLRECLDGVTGE
jgi:hypothetical protein